METVRRCNQCGAPIDENLSVCRYCGEPVATQKKQQQYQQSTPTYEEQPVYEQPAFQANVKTKSKTTAGILAILLGGFGIHKFYLGKIFTGILYMLFCWTYIPSIIGFIEGIVYLTSSEEKFYRKYVLKNK